MRILIEEAGVELTAELNDSTTAAALWRVVPLESPAQTWGAEVYFSVPVQQRRGGPAGHRGSRRRRLLASRRGRVPILRPAAGEARQPHRFSRG